MLLRRAPHPQVAVCTKFRRAIRASGGIVRTTPSMLRCTLDFNSCGVISRTFSANSLRWCLSSSVYMRDVLRGSHL